MLDLPTDDRGEGQEQEEPLQAEAGHSLPRLGLHSPVTFLSKERPMVSGCWPGLQRHLVSRGLCAALRGCRRHCRPDSFRLLRVLTATPTALLSFLHQLELCEGSSSHIPALDPLFSSPLTLLFDSHVWICSGAGLACPPLRTVPPPARLAQPQPTELPPWRSVSSPNGGLYSKATTNGFL